MYTYILLFSNIIIYNSSTIVFPHPIFREKISSITSVSPNGRQNTSPKTSTVSVTPALVIALGHFISRPRHSRKMPIKAQPNRKQLGKNLNSTMLTQHVFLGLMIMNSNTPTCPTNSLFNYLCTYICASPQTSGLPKPTYLHHPKR